MDRPRIVLIGLLMLWLASGALAQGPPETVPWQVEAIAELALPEGLEAYDVFLAPDGERLAYAQRGDDGRALCVWEGATGEETCLPLPEDFPVRLSPIDDLYLPPLVWSPQGDRAAVTGLGGYREDSDLWVVDFAAGTVTNLADDGYGGRVPPRADDPWPAAGLSLEFAPAWSPDGTRLAVAQTLADSAGNFTQQAMVVFDLASGAAHEVAQLPAPDTGDLTPGRVRGLAWSPDGATLAVSLYEIAITDPVEAANGGIWLLALADGAWTQAVTLADAEAALSARNLAERIPPMALAPLQWSPDGAYLAFWVGNAYMGMPGDPYGAEWLLWLALDDGLIRALELPVAPFPLAEGVYLPLPFQAVWVPDGSALLAAVGRRSPEAQMAYEASRDVLATEPFTPLLPDFADADRRLGLYRVDPATGQGVLWGHLPTRFVSPHEAIWGPGDAVIIGGYTLHIAGCDCPPLR